MKPKSIFPVMAAGALLGSFGISSGATATKEDRVTLIVHRVKQLNNLDADLPFEHDDADFYAYVWIDDKEFKTKNFSHDDGRPYWTLTAFPHKDVVDVRIRLLDDDGGDEGKDDKVDINPTSGDRDLTFKFNRRTGKITGDVIGKAGHMIQAQGRGKNSKGRIWFTIE